MEYTRMYKPWFDGAPQNAKKAKATISFDGVISDTETVTIGSNVYEFDYNDTITEGRIKIDMTDYLTKANATLTYDNAPVEADTVTLGAGDSEEVYEFVADVDNLTEGNIAVILGEDFTVDNAVTELAEVINANSALVTALASKSDGTVVLTAKAGGTGANTLAVDTTTSNASFGAGVTTLSGGLNTCTAANGSACLVAALNANEDEVVSATLGADTESVVISNKLVGTEGNNVTVSTTCDNGSFDDGATKLSGGQYATPCQTACYINISGTWYFASTPATKWSENSWYSAALTLL
jgi:hypothetical protein